MFGVKDYKIISDFKREMRLYTFHDMAINDMALWFPVRNIVIPIKEHVLNQLFEGINEKI